ncbi:MAG TPA: carboxypeptidase-like regulatory domain-containing protein [Kofleriaceae bacterium]|nr:carboxypeptidase-like regulatory domain-containing protein [Kofleriaceae bacterium]
MRALLVAAIVLFAATAHADPTMLGGTVRDRDTGTAVEGALVLIAGEHGLAHTLTTDKAGHYAIALPPGTYNVVFVHGTSRTSGKVVVESGTPATLDGRVESLRGEVIVIRDRPAPAVEAKPKNFSSIKAPPYSERAILSDAWTKAWLLLDVDERGRVTRYKFLKKPGYDLESIAGSEVGKLVFEPARDGDGKPMKSWVVWGIEWPSNGWLVKFLGVATRMPPLVGFPPRSMAASVPCAGEGPLNLGSLYPTYRDCSTPDLSKADAEPWVTTRSSAR